VLMEDLLGGDTGTEYITHAHEYGMFESAMHIVFFFANCMCA